MNGTKTPAEAAAEYGRWIKHTGFAQTTQDSYPPRVEKFAAWLEERGDEYHDALTSEHGRDYAVRDYRDELHDAHKYAVATIEFAVSAITHFYAEFLGMGKPRVPRQSPEYDEARGLEPKDLKRVLRAAERDGSRDFALVMLLYGCALRVSEAAKLDLDDLDIHERSGKVWVRNSKGGLSRKLDVPPAVRAAVRPYRDQRLEQIRQAQAGSPVGQPLFLSRVNKRLDVRSIQRVVTNLGASVGVDMSPHTLRHTMAHKLLDEDGWTIEQVRKFLGHKHISSTQVYVKASENRMAELAENVRIAL